MDDAPAWAAGLEGDVAQAPAGDPLAGSNAPAAPSWAAGLEHDITAPAPSAPENGPAGPAPTAHHRAGPTRFQQATAAPAPATPHAAPEPELSWGQVGSQAVHNLIPSAEGVAGSMWDAVTHPSRTLGAIGQVGQGLVSQAEGALGVKQDPAQKAKTEALARAVESHYAQAYGSKKGFKKYLATDPASAAMDASVLLGGAGAGADAAGLAKTAGVLGKVSSAVDPVQNAIRIASLPVKAVVNNPVTRGIQAVGTGVPGDLIKYAGAAGRSADPALQSAFARHLTGQAPSSEIFQTAQRALAARKQALSASYMDSKAGLSAAPVDFTNTYNALDAADAALGKGSAAGFPRAKAALADARTMVDDVAKGPNPNIENADALKKQIWDLQDSTTNDVATQHLKGVYQGVRSDIAGLDPAYDKLMESYQNGLNEINDLGKQAGLSGRAVASTSLAKMLRSMRGATGKDMLPELAQYEPSLPYMLAGAALHPWTAGGARNILELAGLPWAVAMHNPVPMMAQAAIQSPRLAGAMQYGAGALGRAGAKVAAPARVGYYAGRASQEMPDSPGAADDLGDVPSSPADATFQRMIHQESRGRQTDASGAPITSPKGALGISQVMPATGPEAARLAGEPWDLERLKTDEGYNLRLGRAYFDHLVRMFGDPAVAAAAYNGGPGRVQAALDAHGDDWLTHLPAETQDYVHKVAAASGGRIERAAGGKVDDNVEHLVSKLMARAKSAKTAAKHATEPLLKQDDNTIAKALEVARKSIAA